MNVLGEYFKKLFLGTWSVIYFLNSGQYKAITIPLVSVNKSKKSKANNDFCLFMYAQKGNQFGDIK